MKIITKDKLPKWKSTIKKLGQSQIRVKPKEKVEHYISIIKKLHQKEIGNYSRLESIRTYLNDGQPLLIEDNEYLKNQFIEFQKVVGDCEVFDFEKKPVLNKDSEEPQTILIDDVEIDPTSDFISLGKTVAKIIKDSTPHFTIGIYGEWGTGKTTLMTTIEKNLINRGILEKEQKILPIWFNAWQYEREENLATVSLMKKVAYAMAVNDKFAPISKTILDGLVIIGKNITQNLVQEIISKKGNEVEDGFEKKIDYLNKLYQNSIYFDGLKKLKHQMEQLRKLEGKEYRVVIFIDDLDRCSPRKALEVLESINLFLSMHGFIFVLALSHKTVTQLITQAYKATGVKGEDYIKKIIQIPIKIPVWSEEKIITLIENQVKKNIHEEYSNFLCQNSAMVARVVDYNPRQLKRFINNVIIAFETFSNPKSSSKIQFNEIFVVKILKAEWSDFYKELANSRAFRELVKWMISKPHELKKYFKYLNSYTEEEPPEKKQQRFLLLDRIAKQSNGHIDQKQLEILSDFDYETWIFLNHIKDVLFGIKDWSVINSVMSVVEEIPYELPIGTNKSPNEKTKD